MIDAMQVFSITDATYASGQVGLGTQSTGQAYTTAYFDNLIVNTVGGTKPSATGFPQDAQNAADGGLPSDAGVIGEGGFAEGGSAEGGASGGNGSASNGSSGKGCSCRAAGRSHGNGVGALLVAGAVWLGARRRAKRASQRQKHFTRIPHAPAATRAC